MARHTEAVAAIRRPEQMASPRVWLMAGAVLAGLAVATGAFGSHVLPRRLEAAGLDETEIAKRLDIHDQASRYHMVHALGVILAGLIGERRAGNRCSAVAAWLFMAGMLLFSGGLYAYALTGEKSLIAIVPIGGGSFIAGWIALAIAAAKRTDHSVAVEGAP